MSKKDFNIKVVCFGEVLWDVFGNKHLPGGAPLNVAYHLNKLNVESKMISKVGKDSLGNSLMKVIVNWGIDVSNCQQDDTYPTSEVYPLIGSDHEVSYDIRFPVAWDYITYHDSFQQLIAESKAFVFGSLAARNDVSRKTLLKLLRLSSYNVFDINLRAQNYSKETVLELLSHTHLLKLNQEELNMLLGWLKSEEGNEADKVNFLGRTLNIHEILITKGAKGATYYKDGQAFHSPVYSVELTDTVGSGDAFLAAFIAGKLDGFTVEQNLRQAAALGALVASRMGACPDYNLKELEQLTTEQPWE